MNGKHEQTEMAHLRIARIIPAPPGQVFDLWTKPEHLKKWWGPTGVSCLSAEVDLRIGGAYRIGNQMPDGKVLWISGRFLLIEPPGLLEYSWSVEPEVQTTEQVSIRFAAHEQGTMLTLEHRRIGSQALRDRHQQGWIGCLDGLDQLARCVRPDSVD